MAENPTELDPLVRRVAQQFGLGTTGVAVRMPGGLSNELWRLGGFAIKRMVLNAGAPGFADNVERAYEIERRAWAAGVPMPEPVPDPATGRALARVSGSLWRVHRWVDGQPATGTAVEAASLLARIHAVGPVTSGPAPGAGWVADRWGADLVALTERVGGVPDRVPLVDSHRDLDPKNTIRRADGVLAAVDWDAAGPVAVPMEVVALALDWSGGDPPAFAAAVRAYARRSGTTVPDRPWVFAGWVAAQGGWLDHDPATVVALRRLAGQLDVLVATLGSPACR